MLETVKIKNKNRTIIEVSNLHILYEILELKIITVKNIINTFTKPICKILIMTNNSDCDFPVAAQESPT